MILIISACSPAVPGLAIIPDSPEAIDDGWQTGGLSDVGIDPDKIGEMLQAIEDGKFKHLHSILIVKDGKLVFEEYFNGFNRERKAYTASVTKSVTSILIGQARLLAARSENKVEVGDKPGQTQVSLPYFKAARRTFFQSLALSVLMLAGNMLLIILLSLWWFPFGQRGPSSLDMVMLVLAGLSGTLFAFPFYLWRTRKKRAEVSVLST